jgi:ATP-binding cassette, subfamily F, member 3
MISVNLDQIGFTYATDLIFSGLTWEIHDDRVAGLVGPNGCGKSTLLRLVAGELVADEGFIGRRKGLSIGYLEQEPVLEAGSTVWQVALSASPELASVELGLDQVEAQFSDPEVFGNEIALGRLLAQQQRLLLEFERLGGPSYEGRVRSTLRSLGFNDNDMLLKVEALSGGQKKLVALARLVVNRPALLLLDEPDNHLDMDGKAFLANFISNYEGGVVLVSHDRYLLDLVVDQIAELEDGRLTLFNGNYSEYAFEKRMKLARQQQLFQAQQKEITRLEQTARRLMLWGQLYDNKKFSSRGKSILKNLEKIERIEKPVLERKQMRLELAGWVGSSKVLEVRDLLKVFPASRLGDNETTVLASINLLVYRGERVGLIGANGSGKSLLFRLLLSQEQPSSGDIEIGPSVKIGYYAQQHETLNYHQTLLDTIRLAGNFSEEKAVAFLGRFLFGYRQAQEKVSTLSGGERSRLQMALLMLSGANFLLLDEPTNNLDIASTEVLEDILGDFVGTVLVISHDRYFLDRVVNRVEELEHGRLTSYLGNYSDYQIAKLKI